MHWLTYLDSPAVGGTEIQLAHLFSHLLSKGHSITLASPDGVVRRYLTPFVTRSISPSHTNREWRSLLSQHSYSGVLLGQGNVLSLASAAHHRSLPVAWIWGHAIERPDPMSAFLSDWVTRLIVCSDYLRKELAHLNLNTTTLYWGVDTDEFKRATPNEIAFTKKMLGIPESAYVIGTSGRFSNYKRVDDLIDVYFKTQNSLPEIHLLILGKETLPMYQTRYSHHPKIHVVPCEPEEVSRNLTALDVFVSCAQGEGLGCALLEAMSCEIPCLVPPSGGFQEIQRFSQEALLSKDVASFPQEIRHFYHHPKLSMSRGRNNREVVKNHFDLNKTTQQFENLLHSLSC